MEVLWLAIPITKITIVTTTQHFLALTFPSTLQLLFHSSILLYPYFISFTSECSSTYTLGLSLLAKLYTTFFDVNPMITHVKTKPYVAPHTALKIPATCHEPRHIDSLRSSPYLTSSCMVYSSRYRPSGKLSYLVDTKIDSSTDMQVWGY
ncbi:hypothetical protein K450DRAFT_229360 [Umbelopsis ramanniana AG]|uniref:Uncharacterized protein n=1 Tax=Umbelopsis ramanniana AG TaxID=1314678 RepID=A0AAD5EEF0_UMBRA|nr:uncharacterized protein K450DRAFT_229360 [Umbelopsis ramanniana AG]KAI8582173.1 hypothetical protein K450DRAFT_229360 [Umbelopsis ramanniana AG]